jgi:hypothetical protein
VILVRLCFYAPQVVVFARLQVQLVLQAPHLSVVQLLHLQHLLELVVDVRHAGHRWRRRRPEPRRGRVLARQPRGSPPTIARRHGQAQRARALGAEPVVGRLHRAAPSGLRPPRSAAAVFGLRTVRSDDAGRATPPPSCAVVGRCNGCDS